FRSGGAGVSRRLPGRRSGLCALLCRGQWRPRAFRPARLRASPPARGRRGPCRMDAPLHLFRPRPVLFLPPLRPPARGRLRPADVGDPALTSLPIQQLNCCFYYIFVNHFRQRPGSHVPRNHPTCRPILAALPARMGPPDQGIGPVERPARGQDRGKEQSDEAGTPLDEIGPGGKREARGDPPLAARRSPNRRPPSETPVRAWPARPQLTPFASPDRDADGPAAPARSTTGGPAAPRKAGPPDFPRDAGPTGRRPDSPP